jgi:maltooligosyltrehalose trehalohydrolase
VNLFAPNHNYGAPDDLRRLVDRAHGLGLGVILDVVYNHLGPDGNYLHPFASYFTDRYPHEWGAPFDFDGPDSRPVRDFIVANACSWISEYHLDGLRLDATQNLFDASPVHIVKELCESVRASAGGRGVFLSGESERQDERLLRDGLDAIWIDDFHHVNHVISTGRAEGYIQDYEGSARELAACVQRNSLYQGQYFSWQKMRRGTPLDGLPHERFVFALQNHDQVANAPGGARMHALAGEALTRALTTYFLLAPQTPLLFMGQEYFAPQPFLYFVDHYEELMKAVERGRREFLAQFVSWRSALYEENHQPPIGKAALDASRLDVARHEGAAFAFHQELLALRKRIVKPGDRVGAAVIGERAVCLRWPSHLVLLELGSDRTLSAPSEPLLAPPPGHRWKLAFSSESTRFGGRGAYAGDGAGPWRVQGRCATVLEAA